MLYALGVGARRDELDFLYEGRGPKVLPSFAVVPKFQPMLDQLAQCGGNLAMIVHGGERVTIHAALAPAGRLSTTATIRDFYDSASPRAGARRHPHDRRGGQLVAESTSSILFRGEGGFGGPPPPKDCAAPARPEDAPASFTVEQSTSPEQALLYRLSGDLNPLHADPEFARSVGFERGPDPARALHAWLHGAPHRGGGVRRGPLARSLVRRAVQAARLAGRHADHRGLVRRPRRARAAGESQGARRGRHRQGMGGDHRLSASPGDLGFLPSSSP